MSHTTIDLIRHGEPEGGRRFRGNGCDDPLSPKGWQQMRGAVGEHRPWHCIYSSPMRRCRPFAEELGARLGISVTADQRLQEIGFGVWEGLSPEQIRLRDAAGYDAFYRDPVHRQPAGAEPLGDFARRVWDAIAAMAQARAGHHLLVVAHAGVIRATVGQVLQAAPEGWYRIRVDNAGITRIHLGEHGWTLDFHNATIR